MRESGFRGIHARPEPSPTRSAFMAFGFTAFDGFTGFESHQKPRKAIKSQFVGFLRLNERSRLVCWFAVPWILNKWIGITIGLSGHIRIVQISATWSPPACSFHCWSAAVCRKAVQERFTPDNPWIVSPEIRSDFVEYPRTTADISYPG